MSENPDIISPIHSDSGLTPTAREQGKQRLLRFLHSRIGKLTVFLYMMFLVSNSLLLVNVFIGWQHPVFLLVVAQKITWAICVTTALGAVIYFFWHTMRWVGLFIAPLILDLWVLLMTFTNSILSGIPFHQDALAFQIYTSPIVYYVLILWFPIGILSLAAWSLSHTLWAAFHSQRRVSLSVEQPEVTVEEASSEQQ